MNINKLKYWLKPKKQIFKDFSDDVLDGDDLEQNRIFIDRDSKVLFIAHIDTVLSPKYIRKKTKKKKVRRVYAQGLDDRLGCMVAYELSTELQADLLITDHEESAASTGQFHDLKDYNWIVEFDRAGNDVVTYNLDCADFVDVLDRFWDVGYGSFSDVCQLKTDVCCMNLGIAYEYAHSKDSYVDVVKLEEQIEQFKLFYAEYKDTEFKQNHIYNDGDVDDYGCYSYEDECEVCNTVKDDCEYVHNHYICAECFEFMLYDCGVYI